MEKYKYFKLEGEDFWRKKSTTSPYEEVIGYHDKQGIMIRVGEVFELYNNSRFKSTTKELYIKAKERLVKRWLNSYTTNIFIENK